MGSWIKWKLKCLIFLKSGKFFKPELLKSLESLKSSLKLTQIKDLNYSGWSGGWLDQGEIQTNSTSMN